MKLHRVDNTLDMISVDDNVCEMRQCIRAPLTMQCDRRRRIERENRHNNSLSRTNAAILTIIIIYIGKL